jgi:hypothetical protein
MFVVRGAAVLVGGVLWGACGRVGFDVRADGDVAPACGTATRFADDFDGAGIDPFWTRVQQPGMTVTQEGGELKVALDATLPADSFAGLRHAAATVVRDACATFELSEVPDAPGRIAYAELGDNFDTDGIGFRFETGTVALVARTGDVLATYGTRSYDPVAARFVRLQQFGTTFVGSASSSAGGAFVEIGRVEDSGVDIDASSVSIGAVTETPPAGVTSEIEWSSFSLVGP